MTTIPEAKLPFEHLGDYDVVAPISEGGMASVWLGRSSTHPEQLVALKVIRPEHGRNKDFVAMFMDEVGLASRLSHTNIVSVRGAGHDGKQHFLVMDLLRGHSLLEVWKTAHARGKRLPWEVVAWIGARVADALHYAHELVDETGKALHVVHRDVNPANILLTREGVPKLIDFGLAKARDRIASTAFGVVKGKLAYLAPEQALGKPADRRSDIFALGVTLWETSLDRRLFFDETDVETIRRVREADVPDPTTLLDGYPRALADAISRALAPDPNDRWQTAAQFRDALDAFLTSAGYTVDASTLSTLLAELFADTPPAAWERLADETVIDPERTRIWKERQGDAQPAVAPHGFSTTRQLRAGVQPRLLAIAAACGVTGALLMGIAARGCSQRARSEDLERRVAHMEGLLGIDEGGAPSPLKGSPAASAAAVSVDDRSAPCALAKVAGYQAWQEALAKARVNASAAEAACGEIWSDRRKQACYYAAMSGIRTTQAARDAVMQGGAVAREALKNVKDDAKNDAIARARSASDAVSAACGDDGGS
ncbi:MAG: serine/threonine protein kinase [Polyangiaceae bacterium]